MSDKKEALPGHETQSQEMNCPACGRFVGAVTKCPYCGAKVSKRMSLVATRWAAVLLATIGLFLLFLMARNRVAPLQALGSIEPTMNFGLIRVVGTVASDARPFKSGRGMSFNVDDGTGKMVVFTTQKQMEEMQAQNLVPKAGDTIDFAGQLNISDQNSNLKLSGLKSMKLTRAPAATVKLGDISDAFAGKSATVAGKIVSLTAPAADSKRPYELVIADASGEREINFWATEYEQLADSAALTPGTWVRARVSVDTYKDELQLKLSSGKDLEVLEGEPAEAPKTTVQKAAAAYQKKKAAEGAVAPAPARDFSRGRASAAALQPIGDITAADEGETVKVQGVVVFFNADKKENQPFNVILKDEAGDSIYLTYWDNVDEVLADKPVKGATFEAEGEVVIFRDKPQIQIQSGYKLKKTADAKPFTGAKKSSAKKTIALADLSAADNGKDVATRGTLSAARDLNGKGQAWTLSDGDVSVDFIVWNDTLPADAVAALGEGKTVSVIGAQVGEYEGKRQLKAGKFTTVTVQE